MKKTLLTFFISTFPIVFFSTCASLEEGPSGNGPDDFSSSPPDAKKPLPDWCFSGSHPEYPFDEYITNVGVKTGPNDEFLAKGARLDARVGVSEIIMSRVKGSFTHFAKSLLHNERAEFHEEAWSKSFQETELVEHGCRFPSLPKPHYDATSKTLYVLGVMHRGKAAEMILKKSRSAASALETRIGEGEAALSSGKIPAALRAFADVFDGLPAVSSQLPTVWFLLNGGGGVEEILERQRRLEGRCRTGQEAVARLALKIDQHGEYLSLDETEAVEITVTASVIPVGKEAIRAEGVPLKISAPGALKARPAAGRTDGKGALTVTIDPPGREGLLEFDFTAEIDSASLITDGLDPDLSEGLAREVRPIVFLPPTAHKVLAAAIVTSQNGDVGSAALETLKSRVEKYLLDRLADAGVDASPLSSLPDADRLTTLAAGSLAEDLEHKARLLCRAIVHVDVSSAGAVSAKAIWEGLEIVDLRQGRTIHAGILAGEAASRYGADAPRAAGLALDDLLKKIKEPLGRTIDEKCSE